MKHYSDIFKYTAGYILFLWVLLIPQYMYAQSEELEGLLSKAESRGIEKTILQELQNRAESRGISEEQLIQIIEPAVALAEEELPSEMILQKALEGFSKGVPADRMIPLLHNMQGATRRAAPVVDPWMKQQQVQQMIHTRKGQMAEREFRGELIKAVSRGVMKKIPAETFANLLDQIGTETVLNSASPSTIVAAVGVRSDLGGVVDQPLASNDFVVRSLKAGFKAPELQKLPAAVKMAQQRSQLPAANVIDGLSRQLNAGIPAKEILQNLFDGNIGGGPPGGTPPGLQNKKDRGKGNSNRGNGTGT